jgi:epidermal growth factor receptor substrate 15
MSSWESQLSTQEVKYFTQLFQSISKTQEGIVTGSEAVRFFASSGVPNQILSEVYYEIL